MKKGDRIRQRPIQANRSGGIGLQDRLLYMAASCTNEALFRQVRDRFEKFGLTAISPYSNAVNLIDLVPFQLLITGLRFNETSYTL